MTCHKYDIFNTRNEGNLVEGIVTLGLFRFPPPPNFDLAMRYVIVLIERSLNLFLENFYLS